MQNQTTLTKPITIEGIGLHSGSEVSVRLAPADINTDLIFQHMDEDFSITASPFVAKHMPLQTTLEDKQGNVIQTPEHLMAALAGLNIDNCLIQISGGIEIPILDGSALPWVSAIDEAGRTTQDTPRTIHKITQAVHVDIEGRVLSAVSDARDGFRLAIQTDFNGLACGTGEMKAKVTEEFFRTEIAPARTFCFEKDINAIKAAGLAKGGSLENAVVFSDDGTPLNPEGLRFPDEPLRHKFLDAMGDLYLGGALNGKLNLTLPGHSANNALLRKIFERGLDAH